MIQPSPPLALMEIPSLMSTPITNYWCQHVDKACSLSIVNVTISPHQSLPSIDINHINVIISPPLTSMEKGHSPLGASPPILFPLNNLSTFVQGISIWCNAENTFLMLPLWPSLPLELCLYALSSDIGLFSWYASDKYLLLESWEEEWLPLYSI